MKDMAKTEQKTGWKHILEETEARHEWGEKKQLQNTFPCSTSKNIKY